MDYTIILQNITKLCFRNSLFYPNNRHTHDPNTEHVRYLVPSCICLVSIFNFVFCPIYSLSEVADSREGYYLRKSKGIGQENGHRQKDKSRTFTSRRNKREAKSSLQPRSVKYIPLNSLTLLKHHQMKNGEGGGSNKLWWEALPAKRKDKNKVILDELDKLRESVPDWPWLGNNSSLLQKRDPAKMPENKSEDSESSEKLTTETSTRAMDQTLPWLFPIASASIIL